MTQAVSVELRCVRCGGTESIDQEVSPVAGRWVLCEGCKAQGFYLVKRWSTWLVASREGGAQPCELLQHRRQLAEAR